MLMNSFYFRANLVTQLRWLRQ